MPSDSPPARVLRMLDRVLEGSLPAARWLGVAIAPLLASAGPVYRSVRALAAVAILPR